MKVVEVRRHTGYTRRRYDDGTTTYEFSSAVLRDIGMPKFKSALARRERGRAQRQAADERRDRVLALLADGWKPTAIAHELGITEARVRQIRTKGQPT